ncbi:MAG TPA: Rap1a/Tai family immunity protein [Myxococcota bacterium]|nr:Rap1a/Tai family immunity protein [Myxococcota bacterium]
MRAIPITVFAVFLFTSSTAFSQLGYLTGQELLASCEDPAHLPECSRYISGVLDAHKFDLSRFGSPRDFCLPEDLAMEEIERVVLKWLKAHPDRLRVTAANLVLLALTDRFKCRDRD